jgi:hypothetical protein
MRRGDYGHSALSTSDDLLGRILPPLPVLVLKASRSKEMELIQPDEGQQVTVVNSLADRSRGFQ